MRYEGPERRSKPLLHQGVSVADIVAIGTSVITALGIGGPLLIWGGKMDTRMSSIEASHDKSEAAQRVTDTRQDLNAETIKKDFREEVREINKKLDVLIEKSGRGR